MCLFLKIKCNVKSQHLHGAWDNDKTLNDSSTAQTSQRGAAARADGDAGAAAGADGDAGAVRVAHRRRRGACRPENTALSFETSMKNHGSGGDCACVPTPAVSPSCGAAPFRPCDLLIQIPSFLVNNPSFQYKIHQF